MGLLPTFEAEKRSGRCCLGSMCPAAGAETYHIFERLVQGVLEVIVLREKCVLPAGFLPAPGKGALGRDKATNSVGPGMPRE